MSRRRQNAPLEEMMDTLFFLFRKFPVWVGPIVAALFYAVFRWLLPRMLAPVDPEDPLQQTFSHVLQGFALQLAPYVAGGVLLIWITTLLLKFGDRQRLDQQTGLDSIRQAGWHEFELILSEVFRRQGYTVEHLGGSGPDGGVDQRLVQDGDQTLVQCKHWKKKRVGVQVIRELLGVMTSESARHGIVVTSGSFTPDAKDFAQRTGIRLINGRELEALVRSVQRPLPGSSVPPSDVVSGTSGKEEVGPGCPRCGSLMRQRMSRRGANAGSKFWGCSRYPACRGTRTL